MSYYLIRLGQNNKYAEEALDKNFVAIGFSDVYDLGTYKDVEEIKEYILKNNTSNFSISQIANQAGQLYKFGFTMKKGDTVIMPMGEGKFAVGILGDYFYDEIPQTKCDFRHRRSVTWLDKTLSKEDMSTNLTYSIGAILTLFTLDKHQEELEFLIKGGKIPENKKPQRIRDRVLDGLLQLDGREFEEFISHLLSVLGFDEAETTRYTKDKGIDVTGTLNAEGLADVRLQIQVKRYKDNSVGEKTVRELKGSLSMEEHGCIITTSKFNNEAKDEAIKSGHKSIKLIDGEGLASLILLHYENIDEKYKILFGIKKKAQINVEDQFEIV